MRLIKHRLKNLLVAVDSAPNSPSKSSDSGVEDVAVEGPLDVSADVNSTKENGVSVVFFNYSQFRSNLFDTISVVAQFIVFISHTALFVELSTDRSVSETHPDLLLSFFQNTSSVAKSF